jgi:rod shape-determining protein MreC
LAVTRRPSRARFLLVILVLMSVTLITLDQRGGRSALTSVRTHVQDVTRPVQSAVHDLLRPVGNFLTGAADYGSLRHQNQLLRQQIAAMQAGSVAAAAAEARAGAVLKQDHLSFVGSVPTVMADVIEDGSSNYEATIVIDKGASDGIALGQPVVAAGGLVGSIGSVTSTTATVRLLTDPAFVVGVDLGRAVGAAAGTGLGQTLDVSFVSPPTGPGNLESTYRLKIGTTVVTSGLDLAAFPAGIPVATVASFANPPGATDPIVTLRPLVDLTRLSLVSVELWSPQTPAG